MEPLTVTMMKEFSVAYRGQSIVLSRNTNPRFLQLLQIIWIYGSSGISRTHLLQDLYADQALSSPCNCINNLLFQARKHLQDAGLPVGEYIIRRGKNFYPDPELPLRCDAAAFSDCIQKARDSSDPDGRKEFYQNAFQLYRGRILTQYIERPWIVRENGRLRKEYREAGEYLIRQALQDGERDRAEELARHADRIDPEAERLRCIQRDLFRMGAIPDSGRRDVRSSCCSDTGTSTCSEKDPADRDAVPFSAAKTTSEGDFFQFAASVSETTPPILKKSLLQNSHFVPQQPRIISGQSFLDIVQVLCGGFERIGGTIFLVIIRLTDYKGEEISNREKRIARMATLSCSILCNLRRGDVITQYGDSAYLVLMIGHDAAERARIMRKIRVKVRSMEGNKARVLSREISISELG